MMLHWPPFSRYQMRQVKRYAIILSAALIGVTVLGNAITALVRDRVTVSKGSYELKNGFPLFTDSKEYIRMVRNYPYNAGVSLSIHHLAPGESYWDVAYQNRISIETIIAANPFIRSLVPKEGIDIVVPAEDGVLLAIDDVFDVRRMKHRLNYGGEVRGEYLPTPLQLISTDDIRLVFLKEARPVLVNNALEKLYRIKTIFQIPLQGNFTSLFGNRHHPFLQDGAVRYHNGVDIVSRYGTPIRPAREGMVIFAGNRGGFGTTVMIQHDEGYTTLYGHMLPNSITVKCGDWVIKNDIIGRVGSTGLSTGPHLHFTIMRHGQDLNPLLFIW